MDNVIRHRTRYIIPFMTEGDKNPEVIGQGWIKDNMRRGEHDVYQYIIDSVCQGGEMNQSGIGSAFFYERNREVIMPLNYHPDGGGAYRFDITDMGLYLFKSRVGFLWYEVSCFPPRHKRSRNTDDEYLGEFLPDDEMITFNARFKELNYTANIKRFKRIDSDEPFTVGNWAAKIIREAVGNIKYFASRTNTLYKHDSENNPLYVPDKALIFNYVIRKNTDSAELVPYAYYLTKGYKKSYQMARGSENRMRSPFDNVLWYACNEGAGYYAVAGDENKNFFANKMSERFMSDYFLLYLLALNNRYTMILFSQMIGNELPADEEAYLSPGLYPGLSAGGAVEKPNLYDLEKKVTRLATEIDVFIMKNIRASVSFIEHQNEFGDYLTEVFRIKDSIDWLTKGVSALQRLLSKVVETERFFDGNEAIVSWRKEGEYARLQQEKEALESEMYKDGLTGLINQKGYLRFAGDVFKTAKEDNKLFFICSADMNGLKHINDTYGHEAGNIAIKGCIDILRYASKKEDMLFRTGGDEFVVLGLRDRDEGEVDSFCRAAEEKMHMINDSSGLPYEIAISYGPLLQDMSSYEGDYDSLFRKSDEMMYAMKVLKDKYRRE